MYKSLEEFNAGLDWGMHAGYTTGSCACAAAKAALYAALGREIDLVRVLTPAGVFLDLEVREREISEEIWEGHTLQALRLGIQKYAGDDPDVTDGIDIYAKLLLLEKDLLLRCKDRDSRLLEAALDRNLRAEEENAVWICGGEGVGKVEKKGLDRKIGEAAINSVPRQMIRTHLREVLQEAGSSLDVLVEISVPLGRELAKKTFNPKLGIMGGISILGTSGLVLPMSRQALIDTLRLDMQAKAAQNPYIVAAPGNYGMDYAAGILGFEKKNVAEFSNFIGEAIDAALAAGCRGLLLIGHIGKLVKLAGGIMNTHSNDADARCELIAAHLLKVEDTALSAEEILFLARQILQANTTDACLALLKEKGVLQPVMQSLCEAMYRYALQRRDKALQICDKLRKKHGEESAPAPFPMKIGVLSFNLEEGELGRAGEVEEIIRKGKG